MLKPEDLSLIPWDDHVCECGHTIRWHDFHRDQPWPCVFAGCHCGEFTPLGNGKTITLTADDLRQIEGWYLSAAGESVTQEPALRPLLKKLGFDPHVMDESYVSGIPND